MSIIAIVIAILYGISTILLAISAFLVSNVTGFLVLGLLTLVPTIILYLEANKGGGN